MFSSISNFIILKKFNVNIHPLRASILNEVIWNPPITNWMKCKTDGASICRASSCVGIFRNDESKFLCGFAENLGAGAAFLLSHLHFCLSVDHAFL